MKIVTQKDEVKAVIKNAPVMVAENISDNKWKLHIQKDVDGALTEYVGEYASKADCEFVQAYARQHFLAHSEEPFVVPSQAVLGNIEQHAADKLGDIIIQQRLAETSDAVNK